MSIFNHVTLRNVKGCIGKEWSRAAEVDIDLVKLEEQDPGATMSEVNAINLALVQ